MDKPETEPRWKQAFPDYGDLDFEVPEGFEDTSWRNETCPCFMSAELDVALYADYRDPSAREVPGGKRFVLMETVDGQYASTDNVLAVADGFDEILAAIDERRASMAPKV